MYAERFDKIFDNNLDSLACSGNFMANIVQTLHSRDHPGFVQESGTWEWYSSLIIGMNNRGFQITGINEEMTQTITTVKIIQNSEKQRFFEILMSYWVSGEVQDIVFI